MNVDSTITQSVADSIFAAGENAGKIAANNDNEGLASMWYLIITVFGGVVMIVSFLYYSNEVRTKVSDGHSEKLLETHNKQIFKIFVLGAIMGTVILLAGLIAFYLAP